MELTSPVSNNDHIKGKENAPVTLLEYGDFQCPFCGQAYPIVEKLLKLKGDILKVSFRNFPLSQAHPNAEHAAYAAEAAARQGKFWEMHKLLFENQYMLEDDNLIDYAKKLNLDIKQFKKDMNSEEVANDVKDDIISGARSGVNGTPTFYINGERFDQPYELDLLLEAIELAAK